MDDFTIHIKEAIELNKFRLPLYASLTNNRSIKYSKKLIRNEYMVLPFAYLYDRIGNYYQKKGIPYLKDEFVDIAEVLSFSEKYPLDVVNDKPIRQINLTPFRKKVRDFLKRKDYEAIVDLCTLFIHELDEQPMYYCMLKYVIESIRKIAYLIPIHENSCQTIGIGSPTKYSRFLLRMHFMMLKRAKKLDVDVAPIQEAGVPFLFQDLPTIPL